MGCRLVLFTDKELLPAHLQGLDPRTYEIHGAYGHRYPVWEQWWLPRACAEQGVALLHSPMNFGLPVVSPCPTVLTLHDAIDVAFDPPSRQSLRERLHRASHWVARRSASRVITVSQHARHDLVEHFAISERRIVVIPGAADSASLGHAERDEEALVGLPELGRFVLYAGGFDRRKNVEGLLDAFDLAALNDVRLVLVGRAVPDTIQRRIDASEGRIVGTGYLADNALGALYRRALCFVYPSFYEGFGLQLCEAMSQGCAVIAANATSLPEVLGGAGLLFDPTRPSELAQLLRQVAEDATLLRALRERALARGAVFSWRQTAVQTLELYRSLLA